MEDKSNLYQKNASLNPLEMERRSFLERNKAAWIALGVTAFLTALKLWTAHVTSSVSVLSEGVHSALDLASALITFFTIRVATLPADSDHPFGHGKFETLSSFFEALLLIGASIYVFFEAYHSFKNPVEIKQGGLAIFVIVLSLVLSVFAYLQNSKAAIITKSTAIEVNALHFLADAMTCIGVLISLLLTEFTKLLWIDPLIAVFIGIYIITISGKQILKAIYELTDKSLPEEEVNRIQKILTPFESSIIEIHDLKTRKSGINRHIEFHLTLCGKKSVNESHDICDQMEEALKSEFHDSSVHIHVEPCGHHEVKPITRCPLSKDLLCEFREHHKIKE